MNSKQPTFKTYYWLTKPGIIYGNSLAVIAGFFLASAHLGFNWWILPAVVVGSGLVIGCGCVLNNYIDRDIDKKMERTKKRALVSGLISPTKAIAFGTVLGLLGFGILAIFTNWLTVLVGLIGLIFYVIIYGMVKRKSVHGTLVGSISGSIPPVAGYAAVSNQIDLAAWLLFLIMAAWQMPHFYAIAMYRLKDYKAAELPVLPVKSGMRITKIQILVYIVLYIILSSFLFFASFTGIVYLLGMLLLGAYWLKIALTNYNHPASEKWARHVFKVSLLVLLGFCFLVSVGALLP